MFNQVVPFQRVGWGGVGGVEGGCFPWIEQMKHRRCHKHLKIKAFLM
jgi:hypothetical protein